MIAQKEWNVMRLENLQQDQVAEAYVGFPVFFNFL